MRELVVTSDVPCGHDPGVHLEQLRAVLAELEAHRGEKLDQLVVRCRATSDDAAAQKLCDRLCERYSNLTRDLKVRQCLCCIG